MQEFSYLVVEMFDDHRQNLPAVFAKCRSFIDQGRAEGRVLIHWSALTHTKDRFTVDPR